MTCNRIIARARHVWKWMFHNSYRRQYNAVKRFRGENGDETYRLTYSLSPDSVVFDLGGYHGDWTYGISEKYDCKCYIFEPVKSYYEKIVRRFAENNKIRVYHLGLSDRTERGVIYLKDNSSSRFGGSKRPEHGEQTEWKSIKEFINENDIQHIDVMKINIEGREYAILDQLISCGLISRIENLQIQFHRIKALDTDRRIKDISAHLSETHAVTWAFRPYVWENWKRIGNET